MSDQLKGNWRSLSDYRFLSALDLEGQERPTLTIKKVTMEEALKDLQSGWYVLKQSAFLKEQAE